MKKQTAANNEFLRGVKIMMNAKVYARALKLMNASGGELAGGMSQTMTYLQQFFNKPITAEMFMKGRR